MTPSAPARDLESARAPHGDKTFADPFLSTGPSPTVHLVGAGKVGQEFLRLLAGTSLRLRAVTDSEATVCATPALDAERLALHKRAGGSLAALPGAEALPTELAIGLVDADVVVDATPTDPHDPAPGVGRVRAALAGRARLVVAGKDALARVWPTLDGASRARVGFDAALGGTGARLAAEREALCACDAVALVGNATTTLLCEHFARGEGLAPALAAARARGLLEADPTLDLDGSDAAVKLALVCAVLWGARVDPATVARPRADALDPAHVWLAARTGRVCRLVARAGRGGAHPRVAWETLPLGSPLAVPSDRVAYAYTDARGDLRLHAGSALGATRTAAALLDDVVRVTRGARVRGAA